MLQKLRRRLAADQGGFTLIELLVVIVIIGILLAIAVPSYLGFRDRANTKASAANVRAAVPAVETYFSDNGTYAGMTVAALRAIDGGLEPTMVLGAAGLQTATSYCISDLVGNKWAKKAGPSSAVAENSTTC